MKSGYRAFDGVPPSEFSPVPPQLSCAHLHPVLPYRPHDVAHVPLPRPSEQGYFSSHDFRAWLPDYRPHNGELSMGHEEVMREYEKERIREEILREEMRRRILEEEVRWELEMERYNGLRQPILGYHGARPAVQFQRPRYTDSRHLNRSRHCDLRSWHRMREIPHKIMEINEDELILGPSVRKDKVKPPIQKNNGGQVVQKEGVTSAKQRDVSEILHKIVEVKEDESRPQQALLTYKVKPNEKGKQKYQEELKPKEALPEQALPKDKAKPPPNRNKLKKKEDGHKVLQPDNRNKVEQLIFSQSSNKPVVVAEACGLKRKVDSVSALPPSAATSCSTDNADSGKAKKQKMVKKEFSCAFCCITVYGEATRLSHLNGKKHQRKLKILGAKLHTNEKDKKSAPGVELTAAKVKTGKECKAAAEPMTKELKPDGQIIKKVQSVKVKMDKECKAAAEPMREELKSDKQIIMKLQVGMDECKAAAEPMRKELKTDEQRIRKMQVGHEVHEVVERENRLWCEKCHYSCTTSVMMTIHLIGEKHKGNCQKR